MHGTLREEMPGLAPKELIGQTFTVHGATVAGFNSEMRIIRCGCYWDIGSPTAQLGKKSAA